ncbi:hypothetical protein [Ralstonia mannitolilytica]|uniref:hypothetical protein n=1 Tax=Ralstonia mannitolilytica TaxID=105219 RepID=UPI00292F9C11|nr:hypothetical protein [Ralstonia mannitolilytica]
MTFSVGPSRRHRDGSGMVHRNNFIVVERQTSVKHSLCIAQKSDFADFSCAGIAQRTVWRDFLWQKNARLWCGIERVTAAERQSRLKKTDEGALG